MKKFDSQKLFRISQALEATVYICADNRHIGHKTVHEENRTILLSHLDSVSALITDLPLNASALQVERIKTVLAGAEPTYEHIVRLTHELQTRIADELAGVMFMHFNQSEVNLYQNLTPFGSEVAAKFPSALFDIEEAAKCFATARYTACVFHLMRVVELAVQQLGKRLKVSLVTEKNWQNILDEVNKAIRSLPAKTAKQKAIRDSYSAASAHLQNVKEAWRNRVMHPKETYTENEAEEIFNHVKTLMRHLAKMI